MNNFINIFLSSYTFKIVTLGCLILGMISAIVGNFAVLKKESLLADGISHSSLAGITLMFIITGKKDLYLLLIGALIIGIICISIIHYIQIYSKIKFDSAIALILSTFFGLGLIFLTYLKKIPGANKAGISNLIFGQASTLLLNDIYFLIIISIIILVIIIIFWKNFKISIFDKDFSKTIGINSNIYRLLISILITINVILGIQIAGVILISAFMIIPHITARLWSNKLNIIVFTSAILGGLSSFLGSILSSIYENLPTGPTIVLILNIFFIISILLSPKTKILKKLFNRLENKQ